MSFDLFVAMARGASSCPGGRIEKVRVTSRETNIIPLVDPMTGVHYVAEGLVQYRIDYDCVQANRRTQRAMHVIETLGYSLPSVFIPFTSFDSWPNPSLYELTAK